MTGAARAESTRETWARVSSHLALPRRGDADPRPELALRARRDRPGRARRGLPGRLRGQDEAEHDLRRSGRGGDLAQGGTACAGIAWPGSPTTSLGCAACAHRRDRHRAPGLGARRTAAPPGTRRMSLGRTQSVALTGLEGAMVSVEADITQDFRTSPSAGCPMRPAPSRRIGSRPQPPTAACRSRSAGSPSTSRRLDPEVRVRFDVSIAVAVLVASGVLPAPVAEGVVHLGVSDWTGAIRPVRGILPSACRSRRMGAEDVVVPVGNAARQRRPPARASTRCPTSPPWWRTTDGQGDWLPEALCVATGRPPRDP